MSEDHAIASRTSIGPSFFHPLNIKDLPGWYGSGREMNPGSSIMVDGVMIPSVRAPDAINGFTIEPGAYIPRTAWSKNGRPRFDAYDAITSGGPPLLITFGS